MTEQASSKPEPGASAVILALRAPQAARAIGISPRLLATLTSEGRVPHVRLNKAVVYPVADLRRWLSEEASKGHDSTTRCGNRTRNGGAG